MSIVYREDLMEYRDLSEEQKIKAYLMFILDYKEDIEDFMDNFLFDNRGNCYNEKPIRF